MLANAIDTIEGRERMIVLDQEKKIQEDLLKMDWIVRAKTGYEQADKVERINDQESYYWFQHKDASLIDQIQNWDPEAMIALWIE